MLLEPSGLIIERTNAVGLHNLIWAAGDDREARPLGVRWWSVRGAKPVFYRPDGQDGPVKPCRFLSSEVSVISEGGSGSGVTEGAEVGPGRTPCAKRPMNKQEDNMAPMTRVLGLGLLCAAIGTIPG
ncbi:Hypp6465 [Branchiostoma lanceolatum]|uniref:Hypp6465 protein n=1 Tax=Branchiostoma lanceolatum TaxID=7740 RepID=A0A8J9YUU5_BRALA|nr:Hypp6465 [Branchiostoma lanceolatum]